jgi:hypothetical protein
MSLHRHFLARLGSLLLTAALAAPVARATDFTWTGFDDNQYFNYLNWLPLDPGVITGPPGTSDTATINNGDAVFVNQTFTSGWQINSLTLAGGSKLYNVPTLDFFPPPGYEIVVDGAASALTQLSGSGTELIVWANQLGTTADGFDTDLMTVNSGATVSLGNGRLEVDSGMLDINSGATLRGYGWIDLEAANASPFTVLQNDGLIDVYGYGSAGTPVAPLTITASSANGRIDLDGTTGDGAVNLRENGRIIMNAPIGDAFDGQITMDRNTVFQVSADWANNTDGVIDINAGTGTATIRGGATPNTFTNNGTINVNSGTLVMASNYVDNGTTINVGGQGSDATLRLEADAVIANPNFDGSGAGTTHLVVTNGSNTTINAVTFDWDSDGSGTTTIEEGSSLTLNCQIDLSDNIFHGTIVHRGGELNVNNGGAWTMAGTIDAVAIDPVTIHPGSGTWRVTGEINTSGPDVTMIKGDIHEFLSASVLNVNSGVAIIMPDLRADFIGATINVAGGKLQIEGEIDFDATLNLAGGEVVVIDNQTAGWDVDGILKVVPAATISRIAGSDLVHMGTIQVLSGAILEIDSNLVSQGPFIRESGSTVVFNGDTTFAGAFDLDGPDNDLTTVVGDGKTLSISSVDRFSGTLVLEGGTAMIGNTAIDPIVILDCDNPTLTPGKVILKPGVAELPSLVAIELLVECGDIIVDGATTATLDTKVTSTPNAKLDSGVGELVYEKELTAGGGQFIGKQHTIKGGLKVVADTTVDSEIFDVTGQSVVVADGKTLTLNSAAFTSDPTKPREISGSWLIDGGTVAIGTTSIDPATIDEDPNGMPGQVLLKQVSTNIPRIGAVLIELLVRKAFLLTEGGQAEVSAESVTNSTEGTIAGNFKFVADRLTNEGDLAPGNSPGTIEITGDFEQTADGHLVMELAGTTPGTLHDQLLVAGQATLGGELRVELIDGFTPSAGDVFDLFDWGSAVGAFDSLSLPALGVNIVWDTASLYTLGQLQVVAPGIPGDYNNDGKVDAADYVVFRKFEGTTTTLANDPIGGTIGPAHFDQWRGNFGATIGAGTSSTFPTPPSALDSIVPEPTSLAFAITAIAALFSARYGSRSTVDSRPSAFASPGTKRVGNVG